MIREERKASTAYHRALPCCRSALREIVTFSWSTAPWSWTWRCVCGEHPQGPLVLRQDLLSSHAWGGGSALDRTQAAMPAALKMRARAHLPLQRARDRAVPGWPQPGRPGGDFARWVGRARPLQRLWASKDACLHRCRLRGAQLSTLCRHVTLFSAIFSAHTGVRSVMIEYDQRRLPLSKLLQASPAGEQPCMHLMPNTVERLTAWPQHCEAA